MDKSKEQFGLQGELVGELKYGENAWQQAGIYKNSNGGYVQPSDSLAIDRFELKFGAPLGYNNYADVDRLLQTATHIAAVFAKNYGEQIFISAGAKHGNVCGVGISDNPEDSLKKMIEGDERAIFGGSVMTNFDIGKDEAEVLMRHNMGKGKRLLDIVVASDISADAQGAVERKGGRLRGLINPALGSMDENSLDTGKRFRHIRGGFLIQDNYDFVPVIGEIDKHGAEASTEQERDMLLAWAIGSTSNSNTVTLVKGGKLIGNGVGQQDRVSAAELALKRAKDAGHDTNGAVAYSDSFFPFPDGPQKLIDGGVTAIFCTSGSVKDEEVFSTMTSQGVKPYTIPDSKGRGFYAH